MANGSSDPSPREAKRRREGPAGLDLASTRTRAPIQALPWFERWNAGDEPAKIWRELHDDGLELDF